MGQDTNRVQSLAARSVGIIFRAAAQTDVDEWTDGARREIRAIVDAELDEVAAEYLFAATGETYGADEIQTVIETVGRNEFVGLVANDLFDVAARYIIITKQGDAA
nr:hypothetical protein [Corynebacterium lactis]